MGQELPNGIPNHEDAGCGQPSKTVQRSVCRVRNWMENYKNLHTQSFSYFYHNPLGATLLLIQKSKERKESCRENPSWSKSGQGAGQ